MTSGLSKNKVQVYSSTLMSCKAVLKVPSGQIGSTWELYHWISLEKDINRYSFLNFYFHSEPLHAKMNPTSCLWQLLFIADFEGATKSC